MTIYVDDMRREAQVGPIRGRWSHLFTDQDDQTELHRFARRIGMQRSWYQHAEHEAERPWLCHYDVTDVKRRAAIAAGAVPISWFEAGRMHHARVEARRAAEQT